MTIREGIDVFRECYAQITAGQRTVLIVVVACGALAVILLMWQIIDLLRGLPDAIIGRSKNTLKTVSPNVLRGSRARKKEMKDGLEAAAREFASDLDGVRVYFYHERIKGYNAHTDYRYSLGLNQHYASRLLEGDDGKILCGMAVYHEYGHILSHRRQKADGYKFVTFGIKGTRFRHYVEETFCDHISLTMGPVRDAAEWSRIKAGLYSEKHLRARDFSHPSWLKRFDYLHNDFNGELLQRIAGELNYCLTAAEADGIMRHYFGN